MYFCCIRVLRVWHGIVGFGSISGPEGDMSGLHGSNAVGFSLFQESRWSLTSKALSTVCTQRHYMPAASQEWPDGPLLMHVNWPDVSSYFASEVTSVSLHPVAVSGHSFSPPPLASRSPFFLQ